MTHQQHEPPTVGDLLYEAFFSAGVGGSVVAIFFLVLDMAAGEPLATPAILGSAVAGIDAGDGMGVDLTAVAIASVVHLVAFGALGMIAAPLVRAIEKRTQSFIVSAIVLFALLQGGFVLFANTVSAGIIDHVGLVAIVIGNALAAVAMVGFLRRAHSSAEREQGGVKVSEGDPSPA